MVSSFPLPGAGGSPESKPLATGLSQLATTIEMTWKYSPPLAPMEARSAEQTPEAGEWQYEPKWDGFRCLAFRDGGSVELQSKSLQPLARYFPEVAAELAQLKAQKFVLDGEIAVPEGNGFSFDALLQRIHPAASRVKRLAAETPPSLSSSIC